MVLLKFFFIRNQIKFQNELYVKIPRKLLISALKNHRFITGFERLWGGTWRRLYFLKLVLTCYLYVFERVKNLYGRFHRICDIMKYPTWHHFINCNLQDLAGKSTKVSTLTFMIYTEKNDDWNFRYTNIKKNSAEIKQELKNTIFTHYLLITQSLLLSFYLLSNIQSVILLLVTYSYLNWTHKRLLITYSLLKSRSFIFTHYFDHYLLRSNITYYEHPCSFVLFLKKKSEKFSKFRKIMKIGWFLKVFWPFSASKHTPKSFPAIKLRWNLFKSAETGLFKFFWKEKRIEKKNG